MLGLRSPLLLGRLHARVRCQGTDLSRGNFGLETPLTIKSDPPQGPSAHQEQWTPQNWVCFCHLLKCSRGNGALAVLATVTALPAAKASGANIRVGAAQTHPKALLRPRLGAAPVGHILKAAKQPQTCWDQIHASCCLLLRDEQPGGLKRRGVPAYTAPACG